MTSATTTPIYDSQRQHRSSMREQFSYLTPFAVITISCVLCIGLSIGLAILGATVLLAALNVLYVLVIVWQFAVNRRGSNWNVPYAARAARRDARR